MRRPFVTVVLATALALLAACALQPPAPKKIAVSEARLAQLISSQFPFNSQLLEVLDVDVSAPRIVLDPTANRINTSMNLAVAPDGILGLLTKQSYKGSLDLSYGLRFEPRDGSVRMADVQVVRFSIDEVPRLMQRPIQRLGGKLAAELLNDYVLYKLSAEDLQASKGWGYQPGAFQIEASGLSITLDPVERR